MTILYRYLYLLATRHVCFTEPLVFDPFVAEVAALNPTFVQPVASSIPSGDVTGGRPSRSRFKDYSLLLGNLFEFSIWRYFFFIMLQINVICLNLCTYF